MSSPLFPLRLIRATEAKSIKVNKNSTCETIQIANRVANVALTKAREGKTSRGKLSVGCNPSDLKEDAEAEG
jgi:hypothetical protein